MTNKMNKLRTSGYRSQNAYDNLLADLDNSSLKFLSGKYNRDLVYYRIHHNINDQTYAQEYKEMQQRKSMIDEEIKNRKRYGNTSTGLYNEVRFNAENGTIIDSDNNVLEELAYNETETEIINLPSGTKGKSKKEPVWENLSDSLDEDEDFDYELKDEVELSWSEWCNKKKLVLPNEMQRPDI
jgi:hypothetical protein